MINSFAGILILSSLPAATALLPPCVDTVQKTISSKYLPGIYTPFPLALVCITQMVVPLTVPSFLHFFHHVQTPTNPPPPVGYFPSTGIPFNLLPPTSLSSTTTPYSITYQKLDSGGRAISQIDEGEICGSWMGSSPGLKGISRGLDVKVSTLLCFTRRDMYNL